VTDINAPRPLSDDARSAGEIPAEGHPGLLNKAWGVPATVLSVLYTAILAVFAAGVAPFADGRLTNNVVARIWSRLILFTCGIRCEFEGLENLKGIEKAVFVSNHKSLFDILATIARLPRETRFVAKRELRKIPLIGYAMERSGHIIIDRVSGGKAIRRAIEMARLGYSIVVFAEGHRYSDDLVHEFNEGAAWLAIATRMPCVPMAISGTRVIMPRGSRIVSPRHTIRFSFGPPIPTADLKSSDRAGLTRRLEEEVRSRFDPCV
jgi:1-acyl-sn-glycerol-3-phosphate acyltransferase